MFVRLAVLPAIATCCLSGCSSGTEPQAEPQRISLEEAGPIQPGAEVSPDTTQARWTVTEDGQAVDFGNDGAPPLLTLACDLRAEEPLFTIVRHAKAMPEEKALFPFIGNGMRSRFMADAAFSDGEWRWETKLAADDPQLNVFAGRADFTATLPGHGMLEIGGSRIPGEFLAWCRSGGENAAIETPAREPVDQSEASET